MKIIKKITNLISWIIVFLILCISGLLVLSAFDTPVKVRVFSVLSGSMEPEIQTGSLVVVMPQAEYKAGDVITADLRGGKGTVTHRIQEVKETKEGFEYQLKGDANKTPDVDLIAHPRIVGKVVLELPYMGRVVGFAQTQQGFIFLIVVPAVILIYSEMMTIKNEAHRLIKERKKRKLNLLEKIEVEVGEEIEEVEKNIKKVINSEK